MKKFLTLLAALGLLAAAPAIAMTEEAAAPAAVSGPEIGKPAPDFTATDSNGVSHKLSDFKGKNVVLEWTNHECPFVVKHYESGNMQALQKEATDGGAVWLSIVSSAEGKQGHTTPEAANEVIAKDKSAATARLLDSSGEIGRLYAAKTTPHMFVVDKEGVLVYAGAIDDDPSFKQDGIKTATNYVRAALADLAAGKPVTTASTKPYGCSVKYGDS